MFLYISTTDELAHLDIGIKRDLQHEYHLGKLSSRLCPFELEDGSIAILTLDDYKESDQINALEQLLISKQKKLATPARWVLPPTLLLALLNHQVHLSLSRTNKRSVFDTGKNALTHAFQEMIDWGVTHQASDLHISIRERHQQVDIRYSIAGRYIAPERFKNIPTHTVMDILSVAWMDIQGGNGAIFDPNIEQQGRLYREVKSKPIMLRWASIATDQGVSVCFRLLHLDAMTQLSSFDAMGYLPSQIHMFDRAQLSEGGALVLAGVVGSGKSTTIARLMSNIPSDRKIMTLEDPVEYTIPNALQSSVMRMLDGSSVSAFDAKLKTIKRSAMHDLLIGEVRDQETGRAFMYLAGSGSNVYSTVHAASALLIVERLASDFIAIPRDFLTTPGILKLLVYQALLPVLCQTCRLPLLSTDSFHHALGHHQTTSQCLSYVTTLEQTYQIDVSQVFLRNPQGCENCCHPDLPQLNGVQGRTVVAEMLEPSDDLDLLELLKNNQTIQAIKYLSTQTTTDVTSPDMSGKTAMECALYKASIGLIDPRDIELRFGALSSISPSKSKLLSKRHA